METMRRVIGSGRFPELTQKLTRWYGILFWGNCPGFSLENHITACDSATTEKEVQQHEDYLCEKGFLKDQPLWEIVLFPNYKDKDGGSAFALRVHHCLTDGVGHVSLLNAIQGDEAPKQVSQNFTTHLLEWGKFWANLFEIYILYQYPLSTAFLSDFNYNCWVKPKEQHALGRTFHESYELELTEVKKAAKATGFATSEILISAFARGIRADMEAEGEKVPYTMSAIHPLAKPNHPGTLTNHSYLNSIIIPVGVRDRQKRLEMVAADYKLKRVAIPMANLCVSMFGVFLQLANFLPPAGPYCTLAVTNFALSSKPWHLFGAEVKRTSFAFDMSEHVPMVAMFIGYRDKIVLWVKGRADVITSEERTKRIIATMMGEIRDMANNKRE